MLLYANGCSMTFGEEMGPLTDPICNATAWPHHLGKLMGIPVMNDSLGGGSNDRIVRTTVKFIAHYLRKQPAAELRVVIGWTFPIRREFHDAIERRWYHFRPNDPTSAGALTPVYCPTFCSETESIGRYCAQMLSLQGLLKQHRIAYTFFSALSPPRFPIPATISRLIDQTRFFLPESDFWGWTRQQQYPCGPGGHPLQAAHHAWAAAIYQAMWQ